MPVKGNQYQNVIFGALRMVEETGQFPKDLQGLATASGLSAEVVRRSFTSAEALHEALMDHGVTLINDAMRTEIVRANPGDPREQLRALAHGYFTWGGRNRSLFGLMTQALLAPGLPAGSVMERHSASIRDLVSRKLQQCRDMGLLDASVDLDLLLTNAHCLLLGLSLMVVHGRKDNWYLADCDEPSELASRAAGQFIDQIILSRA